MRQGPDGPMDFMRCSKTRQIVFRGPEGCPDRLLDWVGRAGVRPERTLEHKHANSGAESNTSHLVSDHSPLRSDDLLQAFID